MNIPIARLDDSPINIASFIDNNDPPPDNIIIVNYEPVQLINQIASLEVIQVVSNDQSLDDHIDYMRRNYNKNLFYKLKIYYFIYILLFLIIILLFTTNLILKNN
uniref:Uncharacterized protein n=1 Tax=Florenciella sp. virus SA2 TaxID=3240092 RepID=A0AB39JDV6_9VIRU